MQILTMDYYKNKFNEASDNIVVRTPRDENNSNKEIYQNMLTYQPMDPRLNYGYYNSVSNTAPTSLFVHQSLQYEYPPSKPLNCLDAKTDDELWIETWLSKIGKIQINLNSTIAIKTEANDACKEKRIISPMQIHTVKITLKNCLKVLDKLRTMKESLKSNAADISSADWKKYTTEIGVLKDEFSRLISNFENPDTVSLLRRAIEKRRKKRENRKQKRQRNLETFAGIQEERKKINRDIDQWLLSMKEEAEQAKAEEKLEKDNDCVLAEVTKKKSDARKMLSLVSSLIKLRQVREQAAKQRGEKVSLEDTNIFAKITMKLTKIWNDAIDNYIIEEQRLQKMLEKNAIEGSNTARANKEKQITEEWYKAFFGPKCVPSPVYSALTSAENDLETFIAIRKSWDTFLTEDENGSKIPIGWVVPKVYASERWTKYLNTV